MLWQFILTKKLGSCCVQLLIYKSVWRLFHPTAGLSRLDRCNYLGFQLNQLKEQYHGFEYMTHSNYSILADVIPKNWGNFNCPLKKWQLLQKISNQHDLNLVTIIFYSQLYTGQWCLTTTMWYEHFLKLVPAWMLWMLRYTVCLML